MCLAGCKGAVIIKVLGKRLFESPGRGSLQQNAQKGSEMWNFYSDAEDMARRRLLSCLGNNPVHDLPHENVLFLAWRG